MFKELFTESKKVQIGDIVKYKDTGKLYFIYGIGKTYADIMEVDPKTLRLKDNPDEQEVKIADLIFVTKEHNV